MRENEQERTTRGKQAYLDIWVTGTVHTITEACEKSGVSRPTYYRWLDEDADFKKAALEAEQAGRKTGVERIRAKGMSLAQQGDQRLICYFLDRLDPECAPKVYSEQRISGEITLKDIREKADDSG